MLLARAHSTAIAKRPSDHVVEEESAALKTVFLQRTTMSQADFGEKFGLGTQGNVWQYLSGHRPLNLRAAALLTTVK